MIFCSVPSKVGVVQLLNLEKELEILVANFAIVSNKKLLIGFSGGPDSMLLLNLAIRAREVYGLELFAAHMNHGWRAEADQEEEFCRKTCQKLGVAFFSARASDFNVPFDGSKEAQARKIRQLFFSKVLSQTGFDLLVLGHNRTDQVETFFIRLVRGSSLDGLSCMSEFSDNIFRPLLSINKGRVFEICKSLGLEFCTDQSNNDQNFLRNKIRHTLLPSFESIDSSRAIEKLCQTIDLLSLENDFLKKQAKEFVEKSATKDGFINTKEFLAVDKVLAIRIVKQILSSPEVGFVGHFSQGLFDEIYRFLKQTKSPRHKIANIIIFKARSKFRIIRG